MRIACVGYLHGAGGAERQIVMLANALAERGNNVYLIVLAQYNSKYIINSNVQVCDLTTIEESSKIKILNRYLALKKTLNEIKPDISIHYWLQSAYFCALMPKKISGKIIYSERGDPGDSEYKGLLGMVRNICFKRVSGFVFQSEGARNYFDDSIKQRSIVIHNSVSIPKPKDKYLEPCNKREKKIVNVGRLHHQKNQKLLIDAFSRISGDFPEYKLEIYGDGELRNELQDQINRLGLHDKVFLCGTRKNVIDYVYTASLFVLSSDYEGLPNALMEAMAIGVPCISTDCRPGGARTLIHDGINGWITPIGDTGKLANKMREVLLNLNATRSIVENAMKIRETHSSKQVFDRWEQYCKRLLEK